MCPLCGTPYHADCLSDTRDCRLCVTKAGPNRRLELEKARQTRKLLLLGLLSAAVLVAVLLAVIVFSRRGSKGQTLSMEGPAYAASADLEQIRLAISQYESTGKEPRRLLGTSLQPLLPKFIPTIPMDPWKRNYLLDAGVGFIASYGKDGRAGGEAEDSDIYRYFRRPLHPVLARVKKRSGVFFLQLRFNKAFYITDEKLLLSSIFIVDGDGSSQTPLTGKKQVWEIRKDAKDHDPAAGLLLLSTRDTPPKNLADHTALINLCRLKNEEPGFGLKERPSRADKDWPSPFDAEIFGPRAPRYLRSPQGLSPYCGRYRGVAIVKW